jgi:hypothetical protein
MHYRQKLLDSLSTAFLYPFKYRKCFLVLRHAYIPAFFSYARGIFLKRLFFTMNSKGLLRTGCEVIQPIEQFGPISMGGKTVNFFYMAFHRNVITEHPNFFFPVQNPPATRALCLVPYKHYGILLILQPVVQMMHNPTTGTHSGRRNDNCPVFLIIHSSFAH